MKIFLNLKTAIVLILSCVLFAAVVVSCSSSRRGVVKDGKPGAPSGSGENILTCVFPTCSGDECCSKEDSQCDNWCDGDLDLSSSQYKACVALKKDTVKDLVDLFEEKLKRPKERDLEDLEKGDMELVCAAVKHLDHDILADRIDDYNPTRAKDFLEWTAKEKAVVEIFTNAEDDEGVKMFKRLLHKASGVGGDTTDQGVLDGLTEGVNSEESGEHVLYLAFDKNNEGLVEFIHEEIVSHGKELCDKDNRPEPDTTASIDRNNDGDTADSDDIYGSFGFEEEACILAVYCKIAAAGDDAADFRKDMANFLENGGDVAGFIKASLAEGGLGGEENDAEDWSNAACTNLQTYWNDKSDGLTFGL